ncbi:methyltransferase domain-containing protein [candidate division KSB1 bacterium]
MTDQKKYEYQHGFSEMHPEAMYDEKMREQKANKMLAVLGDYFEGKTENLRLLDIGTSTGFISNVLSRKFGRVFGIDIDTKAVKHAKKSFSSDRLKYCIQDSMNIAYQSNTFDAAVCAQVYEHVPDSARLLEEIYRVLKPGGVCFFAAGNRFVLIEGHYQLPLLAAVPKWVGHMYLRLAGKGKYYYENHLSLWGLKKITSRFEIVDYTFKVINEPEKFYADELVKTGTSKQKIAKLILKFAYWLFPTYIWILYKND